MSQSAYFNSTTPLFVKTPTDVIYFTKRENPPISEFDRGILYELDDGKLYYNGLEIATEATADVTSSSNVSVDNSIVRMDGTTGKVIQTSTSTLSDNGNLTLNGKLAIHTTGDATDYNVFLYGGNNTSIIGGDLVGIGNRCMVNNTDAWSSVGIGAHCLESSVDPNNTVACGAYTLYDSVSPQNTTAIGTSSMSGRTTSTGNTIVGYNSWTATVPTAGGQFNTVMGSSAGINGGGNRNVYLGTQQGSGVTGDYNIHIHSTNHGFATTGDNTIYIGNTGDPLILNESNTTRIGTNGTQDQCFISGINTAYDAGNSGYMPVVIGAGTDDQLRFTTPLILSNQYNITTVNTTPYVVQDTDEYIISTVSAVGVSAITLPLCSSGKRKIVVVDGGGNSAPNTITINISGGDTVNNGASYLINYDYGTVTLINDGVSAWWAVSNRFQ